MNVTINITANVSVQSLQCSASLSVTGGSLTLTKGSSEVIGSFAVGGGRSLSVNGAGTVFAANGAASLNDALLYAENGGVLSVPGVGQAALIGENYLTWQAVGAGSRIVLANLTNIIGDSLGRGYSWSLRALNLIIAHIFFAEILIKCWNRNALCILRGDA